MEREKIEEIVSKHRHEKAALLAILHEVQEMENHVGMESLRHIAGLMEVSFAHVYGLATFYSAFSTEKRGETLVRVCDGIACHLKGGHELVETVQSELHTKMGGTSWDEKYTLEKVQCLGLCTIGPNAEFKGKTFSRLRGERVRQILIEKKED